MERDIKRLGGNFSIGILLITGSLVFYFIQFITFKDIRDTVFYFLQDLAFVPLQVFMVSLVLDRILSKREKEEKLKKINIVISAFFNEIGTSLIKKLSEFSLNFEELKANMGIKNEICFDDFDKLLNVVENFEFKVDSRKADLKFLYSYMSDAKSYILGMFENPNLLEHDTFTEMLWALFHIIDELDNRETLKGLPKSDLDHISGDIKRALQLGMIEWIYYMKHLKKEYPYLFSLEVRKNPFSAKNNVIIYS